MQASTFLRSALKYVPMLVVIIVALMGVLLSKERAVQITTNTQLQVESNSSGLTILSEPARPCIGFQIFTSLPPKCRTSDGTLATFNGFSSNIITPPGPK